MADVGDLVTIRYNHTSDRPIRIRLSKTENRPADGIVHVSEPLGEAVLGVSVDDEIEVNIGGTLRRGIIERIEKYPSRPARVDVPDDDEPYGHSEHAAPADFYPTESAIHTPQGRHGIASPLLCTYCEATFDDLGLQLNKDRFFDADYKPTLVKLIERCVSVEGPIRDDVLARRIGSVHGFHKAGARIREHAASIACSLYKTTKESNGTFFWPLGEAPDVWITFRKSKGEPRPIDEIAIQELLALAFLAMKDRRYATEDPLVVMSRIAGLQRLRAPSREGLALAQKRALLPMRSPALATA